MPYFPSSSCEMESSSSLRHCVTTLRSLLRISCSMSGRSLWLRCRRLLTKFFQSCRNQFIEAKANDTNRIDGLACPGVANLLWWSIRLLLVSVGSMHDVIASIHGVIDCLLQLFLVSPQPFGNLHPRVVDSQKRSGDMN